jgi:hypothetical protein
MSYRSILVSAVFMLPAIAAPSPFFIRTIPDHYRKMEDFKVPHAVHTLPWIQRRAVFTHWSKNQMANPSREWWSTTQ